MKEYPNYYIFRISKKNTETIQRYSLCPRVDPLGLEDALLESSRRGPDRLWLGFRGLGVGDIGRKLYEEVGLRPRREGDEDFLPLELPSAGSVVIGAAWGVLCIFSKS